MAPPFNNGCLFGVLRPLNYLQEKGRMATDLKRLKKHFKAYEPTLKELERKYQARALINRLAVKFLSSTKRRLTASSHGIDILR